MKFTIDSAEFKSITERAAVVSNKKGPVVYVTSINLIADAENQKVTIRATNLTSYAQVFTENAESTRNRPRSSQSMADGLARCSPKWVCAMSI